MTHEMMDYPYGKFGDCSFKRFGPVVQRDRHRRALYSCDSHHRHHALELINESRKYYLFIAKNFA